MRLIAFTLVLDGMPYIERHLPILQATKLDWRWIVVEGTAQNNGSTKWCRPQAPRLSTDGTHEYLQSIKDPRVTCLHSPDWPSKDAMVNAALEQITEPCVLMEIDADEAWTPQQLEEIFQLFCSDPILQAVKFACRYFVGPDLILQGENCYGDYPYEWNRAWKFTPGMRFKSHEPPVLDVETVYFMDKDETRRLGLVFDHHAYSTEAQCAFKEKYYGYAGLVNGWRALQRNQNFPVSLSKFFGHVQGDLPMVVRV